MTIRAPTLLALALLTPATFVGCAARQRDLAPAETGIALAAEAPRAGRGDLILEGGGREAEAATELIVRRAGPAPTVCVVTTASEGEGHPEKRFRRYAQLGLRLLDIAPGDGDKAET